MDESQVQGDKANPTIVPIGATLRYCFLASHNFSGKTSDDADRCEAPFRLRRFDWSQVEHFGGPLDDATRIQVGQSPVYLLDRF